MQSKSLLIVFALAMGTAVLAAGAVTVAADGHASVDVTQNDNGNVTVPVAQNDTAVANSTVEVSTVDNTTYSGTSEYITDENGTVGLPAPENDTTVAVTATVDNETVSIEAELNAAGNTEEDDEKENFGQLVSAFVLENNPGNNDANQTGPPVFAGPGGDDENESDAGPPENGSEAGPPENAGPLEDADSGDDADEEETEKDDDDGGEGRPGGAGY
jgi:hypothetical protein